MVERSGNGQELGALTRRLAEVEARIAELSVERAALLERLGPATPVPPGPEGEPPRGMASRTAAVERARRSSAREAKMRLYWEAIEILRAEGRPMTAPEIHGLHPMRALFDTDALYRTLYKRVGSVLASHAGAFWPIGEALPEGWEPRPQGPGPLPRRPPPAGPTARGRP